MKAGKELDALIAQKVMGWKIKDHGHPGITYWWNSNNEIGAPADDWSGLDGDQEVSAWSPSTKIADAFMVFEKMIAEESKSDEPYKGLQLVTDTKCWWVRGGIYGDYNFPEAETAPHAICLASIGTPS